MLTLDINHINDFRKYYRASDMVDFWFFFPEASPLKRLAICFDKDDYINNKEYLDSYDSFRIDSPKEYKLVERIESTGSKEDYIKLFDKIKEINDHAVILFFDVEGDNELRYKREAGISLNVNIGEDICIEAVGKGFDGREISKGICVHERYFIPWFELRNLSIDNFKDYQIFKTSQSSYAKSRIERINYLKNLNLDEKDFINYIPEVYSDIPMYIWDDLLKTIILLLEKKEDILIKCGYKNFAIGGNTQNGKCFLWQMYNKERYNV